MCHKHTRAHAEKMSHTHTDDATGAYARCGLYGTGTVVLGFQKVITGEACAALTILQAGRTINCLQRVPVSLARAEARTKTEDI